MYVRRHDVLPFCAAIYTNIHAYHADCLGRSLLNPAGVKVLPAATIAPASIVEVYMWLLIIEQCVVC